MTDVLVDRLKIAASPCRTHSAPLPGGERVVEVAGFAAQVGIDAVTAARLVYRHGARTDLITERIRERPLEATVVCACEPVIEAEIRHVLVQEFASTVDDVARRTRLGLGACGGMRCAVRCGQIVAQERHLSPREGGRQALRFLARQASTRCVAGGQAQVQQEALLLATVRAELGSLIEEDR
jgi:glycerol-3-phosphate dehydrogenase